MNIIENEQKNILRYALENDIIDLNHIQSVINMKNDLKILDSHPYKIWCGNNGNWYTYLPDENKKRILKKRRTKEDIENVIISYWKEKNNTHTLESVFFEWVNDKLKYGEIQKGTFDRYETDFCRFFNESETDLSKIDVALISEDVLEEFIRLTIKNKNLTSKSYAGLRTILLGTFKYAKKHKYTEINISTFFSNLDLSKRIFKKNIKNKENEVFTEEEIELIIRYINGRNDKIRELGILLAIYTGLRPGELASLKHEDINIKEKTLHVCRTEIKYKDENGKCVIDVRDYPKSEAGDRYLILCDKAINVIERILRLNKSGKFLIQDEYTKRRITENGFNHKLSRICDAVKIHKRTMHKLRKTYGTKLIDNGVNDSIITEQMGHADIKTTRKYYYFSNHNQEEKIRQLNSIW